MLNIFSCTFWPSSCFLWRNVSLGLPILFWSGCLFFRYWAAWAICVFWILIPRQWLLLQIVSPILRVVFPYCLWFLLLYISFSVCAPFVYLFFFYYYYRRWVKKRFSCDLCQRVFCQGFPGGSVVRIHLPVQETGVRSLIWEDPTCHGATKSMHHNYRACDLEPESWNYWIYVPQLLKLVHPKVQALKQEKPLQWEARKLQLECGPHSLKLEKSLHSNTQCSQK